MKWFQSLTVTRILAIVLLLVLPGGLFILAFSLYDKKLFDKTLVRIMKRFKDKDVQPNGEING